MGRKLKLKCFKLIIVAVTGLMSGCGLGGQVDRLKALEKCSFTFQSADSVYLAGTDVSQLVTKHGFNPLASPSFALAMLQQKVPLHARIILQVLNPGSEEAGISAFEYRIMIKDVQLAEGYFDRPVTIQPNGGTAQVPVKINTDLYPVLADSGNQKAIAGFLSSAEEKTAVITLKIKPAFDVGNEKVKYPGYIDINKEISNRQLQSFIQK